MSHARVVQSRSMSHARVVQSRSMSHARVVQSRSMSHARVVLDVARANRARCRTRASCIALDVARKGRAIALDVAFATLFLQRFRGPFRCV
jgi:hypothetical protein